MFLTKEYQVVLQGKVEGFESHNCFLVVFIIIISFIFLDVMYAHIHKPKFPMFQMDKVLKSHGHTAIYLPPYHTKLNAIELVSSNLKVFVGCRNLQFKKVKVEELAQESIKSIGEKEWSSCCKHVIDIEQEFWRRDTAVEEEVDRVLIYVAPDSDVSNLEDTDTASEGNELTDTADESKSFV